MRDPQLPNFHLRRHFDTYVGQQSPKQSFSYAALLLFAGAVASDVEVISTHIEEDPSLLHPMHHGRKACWVGERHHRKRDAGCVWV